MRKSVWLWVMSSLFAWHTQAQSLVGTWKTVDDETQKARSYVKMYKTKSGKYAGKIVKLLDADQQNATCDKCTDYRKGEPILNMVIVTGLASSGDEWKGGKILDPEKGKVYTCKMWLDEANELKVRGYLGPFYRTQTWYRVK
ncbi:MAG: DUF2147 domain-containing protein [Thermonemataceae bacterium]